MSPLLLLPLAFAGNPAAETEHATNQTQQHQVVRQQQRGLAGIISKSTVQSKRKVRKLNGSGGSDFGGLIRLIETSVVPDCWDTTGFSSATSGPGGSATQGAQQLADLIQQEVEPQSWDINGGLGSIGFLGK